jgi:hypothetical protein
MSIRNFMRVSGSDSMQTAQDNDAQKPDGLQDIRRALKKR